MSVRNRTDWARHVDQIIRSQHYTWLAEGLGGDPPEKALVDITTDIMHICKREGISWVTLVEQSQAQFDEEECALAS